MSYPKQSYSQSGEDLIVDYFMKVKRYCEIGAWRPIELSNTYLFYTQGASGILVEPNPDMIQDLKSVRPKDLVIHAGCSWDGRTEADLQIMSATTISTFDPETADRTMEFYGKNMKIEKSVKVPMLSLDEILGEEEFDLLSIDAEGLDLKILQSMSFKNRPKIMIVEHDFSDQSIPIFLRTKDYNMIAHTGLNGIFRTMTTR